MKNLFFAALAVAAFASCSQSETIDENASAKKAMTFDQAYIGKITRGVPVTGTAFADQSTMGVFSTGAASTADNLTNQKVTFDAGAWIYSPQKFYEANKTYTFDAYTPYKDGVTSIDDAFTGYQVVAAVAQQVDLMYAQQVTGVTWDGQAATVMAPIQFTFKHALAQVKFSARTIADYTTSYTLKITKLVLKQVPSTATLTPATGAWSTPTVPVDYTIVADQALTQNMDLITTANKDVLMLIPQSFTSDLTVEITINVQDAAGHTPDATVTKGDHVITATIPATAIAPTVWARNHIYNYQLNLNLDNILNMKSIIFGEPIVEDWAAEENIPSTVTPPIPTPAP